MTYPQFNGFIPPQQNYESLMNQLNQLRNMQNNLQSPIQTQQQTSGVIQSGTFVVVKDLQDMANYPVPTDGTPVNIFIDGKGVFYSKKMTNGTTNCQPFTFSPLNTIGSENDIKTDLNNDMPEWAKILIDNQDEMRKEINALKSKKNKKVETENLEVVEDGI